MNETTVNRTYLEALSFSSLVELADEYGVDVPKDLDRRFLIAELLELTKENNPIEEKMIIEPEEESDQVQNLPQNYNKTQVSCVLRNPSWLFVFWNINDSDAENLHNEECSLKLRICSMKNQEEQIPLEAFELNCAVESQEQYVLLPNLCEFVKVELLIEEKMNNSKVLAFSPIVAIPQGNEFVYNFQPGRDESFSPIMKLSGAEDIFLQQYKHHRHSLV